jgi:hypothetical protein
LCIQLRIYRLSTSREHYENDKCDECIFSFSHDVHLPIVSNSNLLSIVMDALTLIAVPKRAENFMTLFL